MSSPDQILWPSELGKWHRKKAGKFKAKMAMDDASYKALQASVGSIALREFDKNRTARTQPPEVMETIKTKALEKHRNLLERYRDAWPVEVLAVAFIENHLQYQKGPKPRYRIAEIDVHVEAFANSSTAVPIPEADVVDMTIDVDDAPLPSSAPSSDSTDSPGAPRKLVDIDEWRKEEIIRFFSGALVLAAEHGFLDVVRTLVEIGVDVDSTHSDIPSFFARRGALRAALMRDRPDIAVFLLERGATALDEDFIAASSDGYYPVVRALLDRGMNPNVSGNDNRTALGAAILDDQMDIIQLLLQHGATISPADLVDACSYSQASTIRALLDHGVDVNFPRETEDEGLVTALGAAIEQDRVDIVPLLLDHGATISPTDFVDACSHSQASIICILLDHGVDVNFSREYEDEGPVTALGAAIEQGRVDIVLLLLDLGAIISPDFVHAVSRSDISTVRTLLSKEVDINALSTDGKTLLDIAIQQGRTEVAELLLERGTECYSANLIDASFYGYISIVRTLLDKGLNINALSANAKTPLDVALQQGHTAIAELLLERKAHCTPANLLDASFYGRVSVVCTLLDRGLDINAPGKNNKSPLDVAIQQGHTDVAELLLERGAGCSSANLIDASFYGYTSTVCILLDKGLNINTLGADGKTLLDIAIQRGHDAMTGLLLERGADCSPSTLVDASFYGRLSVVLDLLSKGLNINALDADGKTPLDVAIQRGHDTMTRLFLERGAHCSPANLFDASFYGRGSIVRALLDKGVDINSLGKDGKTALYAAIQQGHTDIAELLLVRGADCSHRNLIDASSRGDTFIISALLSKGVDVNALGVDGRTALEIASLRGDYPTFQYLSQRGATSSSAISSHYLSLPTE